MASRRSINNIRQLRGAILKHFVRNSDALAGKKLHFFSRMYFWTGQERYKKVLLDSHINEGPNAKSLESTPRRNKYFKRYPILLELNRNMFRIFIDHVIFKRNTKKTLFDTYGVDKLDNLITNLYNDRKAIAILSTHAINAQYIYRSFINNSLEDLDLDYFMSIAENEYNIEDPYDLRLLVYLVTHIVIGESLFYTRKISPSRLSNVHDLLELADNIIRENFNKLSLDNKLEFLVACRLSKHATNLESKIFDECLLSLHDNDNYLVDSVNIYSYRKTSSTLVQSEHRNVLFLMATSPWRLE